MTDVWNYPPLPYPAVYGYNTRDDVCIPNYYTANQMHEYILAYRKAVYYTAPETDEKIDL